MLLVMTRVNVGTPKAQLSRNLKLVKKGERVLVLDRKLPIAELVPLPEHESVWVRLARAGKCKLGSQDWSGFRPIKLKRSVPVERLLRDAGEDMLGARRSTSIPRRWRAFA